MLSFVNDYSEGAHEKILEALIKTNTEQLPGYGNDKYTESAKEKIKAACNCPEAEVWFLSGGTQTNQIVIDSILKSYEGVITSSTGHINIHEAGAIEFTGHKVLSIEQKNGKLDPNDLKAYLKKFYQDESHSHMVQPGMVYITHPTEYGTLYEKSELQSISDICREYNLPLYLDGARLGYGLVTPSSDVTLSDIAKLCDVFYIGGTKVGALCGEAVVFTKNNMPKAFVTTVKQHGGLSAKGRLYGVQFDTLFTDNLYFEISKNAIATATRLKEIFHEKGYKSFIDSPTNQTFIVLDDEKAEELKKYVKYDFWEKPDDNHTVVRFATSWATSFDDVEALGKIL